MCRAVRCASCRKTTWAGCGLHVDQVRAGVPDQDWCSGHARPGAGAAAETATSWIRRLLGNRTGS